MRRLCWIILAAALVLSPASALAGTYEGDDALMEGAQALQFKINSHFTLGGFRGSTLSYQRFLKDRFAFRIGLTLGSEHRNTEGALSLHESGTEEWYDGGADLVFYDHDYSLAAQVLWYSGGPPISLYYGGGLRFDYGKFRDDRAYYRYYEEEPFIRFRTYETSSWGVGLTGTIGVQWLVTSFIALHAEYGLSLMYGSGSREETSYEEPEGDSYREASDWTTTELRSHGVLFGLSVYF